MFQTLKLSTSTGREANICSSKPHHSQTPRSPRNNLKSTKTTAEASIKSSNSQTGTNKRGQKILRACDRCRLYRVKCGSRPCEQCRSAKAKCVTSKDGAPQRRAAHTQPDYGISSASQVFNGHVSTSRKPDHQSGKHAPSLSAEKNFDTDYNGSSHTATVSFSNENIDAYPRFSRSTPLFNKINSLWFGTTTSIDFAQVDSPLDPMSANSFPRIPDLHPLHQQLACKTLPTLDAKALLDYVRLFWDAYQAFVPTLDTRLFDSLQECLLHADSTGIQPPENPFLDIAVALGMQFAQNCGLTSHPLELNFDYGASLFQSRALSHIGSSHFRRCREHLMFENRVTTASIHCQTLMAIYLMHDNHLQGAYSILGSALRDAFHLNLHKEPASELSKIERDSRKKLWWLLYTLDVQCSYQLDKPSAVQTSTISISLPFDVDVGNNASLEVNTDLHGFRVYSYSEQLAKLAVAIVSIWKRAPPSISPNLCDGVQDICALEQHADCFAGALGALESWRDSLPNHLRCFSRGSEYINADLSGPTLNSDTFALNLEFQRPRMILLLQYHDVNNLMRRTFISFPRTLNQQRQPQTDKHAQCALHHSIIIADILHDTFNVLFGWPEALQPLWNATVTMIVFVAANPLCTQSAGARNTILKSLNIFRASASTCMLALHASKAIESLSVRLEELVRSVEQGPGFSRPNTAPSTAIPSLTSSCSASTTAQSPVMGMDSLGVAPVPMLPLGSEGLGCDGSNSWGPIFADEDLRSWMEVIDGATWQTYQQSLDDFLINPTGSLNPCVS